MTRQRQWPEGTPVVEVSAGGIDYTNPDALSAKYPGEFETFDDPREAVDAAIAICLSWREDGEKEAQVGHGATGGMTMPFDTSTFEAAEEWAHGVYEGLPKCSRCGGVLGREKYRSFELEDEEFCSEVCAQLAEEEHWAQDKPELEVCDSCLLSHGGLRPRCPRAFHAS